jgi:hypothetical protein
MEEDDDDNMLFFIVLFSLVFVTIQTPCFLNTKNFQPTSVKGFLKGEISYKGNVKIRFIFWIYFCILNLVNYNIIINIILGEKEEEEEKNIM